MRASWAGSTGPPGRRCATASTAGATPGPCAPASAVTRTPIWPHWSSGHASQFCRRSFFERILRVRAGDPGLRPPPADPQPLERVADGLITDPLGRDPVLGADLGGQGQGPSGAAELARALV